VVYSQTILCSPQTIVPLLGGREIPQSRRRVSLFTGHDYPISARQQYEGAGLLGDLSVGIDFSLDEGSTWSTLIPVGPSLATATDVYGPWQVLPVEAAQQDDVIVRAIAVGSAALGITVNFIELQFRP
jgi:hypothetical protein